MAEKKLEKKLAVYDQPNSYRIRLIDEREKNGK